MQVGQMLVLGSSPYWLEQEQYALVFVNSCTCVSMPITASYSTCARSSWRHLARAGLRPMRCAPNNVPAELYWRAAPPLPLHCK